MKKIFIPLALLFLISCSGNKKEQPANQNAAFEVLKNNFMEAFWKIHPNWASSAGYHKYDSVLEIPDQKSRLYQLEFNK